MVEAVSERHYGVDQVAAIWSMSNDRVRHAGPQITEFKKLPGNEEWER